MTRCYDMTDAEKMVSRIDWELFRKQKEYLIAMAGDSDRLTEEVVMLDGIINLMDAIQDAFEPPQYMDNWDGISEYD